MPKRFTITEKWEDSWFWELKPHEKLLWNYICDKCNLAGFWEINLELAAIQTKIPKSAILGAVQGLSRGYIGNDKYLWIRRFIEHQGNLPLNPQNNAHKHIIQLLEKFHSIFPEVDFYKEMETQFLGATQGLLSPTSKGISKGNSNGKGKSKEKFLDFVFLSTDEYKKLVDKFGKPQAESLIEDLNLGIGSKGYKYKSHYLTILSWAKKNKVRSLADAPQAAICIVDRKPAHDYKPNGARQPIWLCLDCIRALGGQDWGKMSKPEIERAVEEGKRRPPPEAKDPDGQDKKRVAVAKLTQGLSDKMKG